MGGGGAEGGGAEARRARGSRGKGKGWWVERERGVSSQTFRMGAGPTLGLLQEMRGSPSLFVTASLPAMAPCLNPPATSPGQVCRALLGPSGPSSDVQAAQNFTTAPSQQALVTTQGTRPGRPPACPTPTPAEAEAAWPARQVPHPGCKAHAFYSPVPLGGGRSTDPPRPPVTRTNHPSPSRGSARP